MSFFRYEGVTHWYKGQCHAHSIASDGAKTISELAEMYAAAGHSFLFVTDHWKRMDALRSPNGAPLLLLDGMEFDGCDRGGHYYHVVCLGRCEGISEKHDLEDAMQKAREQSCLLILAHPYWSGNDVADAIAHPFDGVEIYNHAAACDTGRSCGLLYWDKMLDHAPKTLGLAVDDIHATVTNSVWGGGWIAVAAKERTEKAILRAIAEGRFYASCGPEIQTIRREEGNLVLETSPVAAIRLVGPAWNAQRVVAREGSTITEARFVLPKGWPWMRVELEDIYGRRAWTNALFLENSRD